MNIYFLPPIVTKETDHYVIDDPNKPAHKEIFSSTPIYIIEEKEGGVFLNNYDENRIKYGDTWHRTIEDAKHQAEFEYNKYGKPIAQWLWKEIPEGHDPLEYLLSKVKHKKYIQDYKNLKGILNDWDFLNVIDEDNQNEYNDLIDPILHILEKQVTKEKLIETIENFVVKHYETVPHGTYEVSERIITWWNRN